ncbi:MAG: Glu-tRNA(Gln) amidotransferase subunit GatD [Thermoplasmata archaeon]
MSEKSTENLQEGDRIRVTKEGKSYTGVLMPHHRFSGDDIVTIKLDNGYNIGLKVEEGDELEVIEKGDKISRQSPDSFSLDESKPKIAILGTGGTIASYVEYKTGAVYPAQSAEDMLLSNPEIAERCYPTMEVILSKFSEDLEPEDWVDIADKVVEKFEDGAEGVVIAHGTDTMGYTSAALSVLLENLDKPVVLVGSQRSSDRPSSDAHLNLLGAIEVAKSGKGGVYVVMHGSMDDDRCSIHLGTKVRKMHTSRRDAFKSINKEPVGWVEPESGDINLDIDESNTDHKVKRRGDINPNVGIIYAHPGLNPEDIERLNEKDGLVIAGTGLGHINSKLVGTLQEYINGGKPVVMTSQCLYGTVNDYVYASGRKLIEIGVIPGGDMLPETALVKLMWALTMDDVEEIMTTNTAGELTDRRVR